ncbi:MAG: hypothetical protein GY940_07910 [bacterium]|nr:hypothetical protein [bacterium]
MAFSNDELDHLLGDSYISLTNAVESPDVFSILKNYRYDEARFKEGWAVYQVARDAYHDKPRKDGLFTGARVVVEETWAQLKDVYYDHLGIARIVFDKETGLLDQLEARGRRKNTESGRIKQTKVFYTNSLASEEILGRLKTMGITKKKLKDGLALVEKFEQAVTEKEACKGEARRATKKREQAFIELRKWMKKFKQIALIALKGTQLPEKMGWKV